MTGPERTDLDVEIARKILKIKRLYTASGAPWNPESVTRPWYIPSGKPWRTHSIDAKCVPYFSLDMQAAWSLAQEFIRSGWGVMMLACPEHPETPPEKYHTCRLMAEGITVAGDGESMPVAMCRAFLQAAAEFNARRSPAPAPGAQED